MITFNMYFLDQYGKGLKFPHFLTPLIVTQLKFEIQNRANFLENLYSNLVWARKK